MVKLRVDLHVYSCLLCMTLMMSLGISLTSWPNSNIDDPPHLSYSQPQESRSRSRSSRLITPCHNCLCHRDDHDSIFLVDCSGQNFTNIPSNLPDSVTMDFSRNQLNNDGASSNWSVCNKYTKLRYVSFAFSGLTTLPKLLKGCQEALVNLTLTGNWLTVAAPSDFQDLQNLRTLRGLWVRNRLPTTAFKFLKTLSILELTYGASSIPADLFEPLSNLRVLDVTLNQAQGWPSDLALPSGLTELRLKGFKVKSLPSGFLRELANLQVLHLDLPELRSLEWKPREFPATGLQHLSVRGVWEVTSESMAQLTSLQSLKLRDIRTFTDTEFFKSLGNMKNLEIINCSLASDDLHWVKELATLTSLALKHTQLAELSPDVLSGLSALHFLDLSFNRLKIIPERFLLPVSNTLEGLDLSGNLLERPEITVFPAMPNLKGLILSQNRLPSLDLDTFVNVSSLRQLIVQGNALKHVTGDRIRHDGFTLLNLFDLSSNLLETIPEGVPLDKVATLDLSGNPLTKSLPIGRLEALNTVVEIGDTPIACDCEMYDKLFVRGVLSGGVCKSPPSLRGKKVYQLDKHCNNATGTTDENQPMTTTTAPNQINPEEGVRKEILRTITVPSRVSERVEITTIAATTLRNTAMASGNDGTSVGGMLHTNESGESTTKESLSSNFTKGPMTSNNNSDARNYTMNVTALPDFEFDATAITALRIPLVIKKENPNMRNGFGELNSTGTLTDSDVSRLPDTVSTRNESGLSGPSDIDTGGTQTDPDIPRIRNSTYYTHNESHSDIARPRGVTDSTKQHDDSSINGHDKNNSTDGSVINDNQLNDTDIVANWTYGVTIPTLSRESSSTEDSSEATRGGASIEQNSGERSLEPGAGNTNDESFGHSPLPWVIVFCLLLLAMLVFGYILFQRKLRSGSRTLADDTGTDKDAHDKMELMELGVAPLGGMPVIM